MSLHTLHDINNLDDPLKMFLVDFTIAVPPLNPFSADLADKLELRAQSFSFPAIKGDTTVVEWGGHQRTYAGKQTRAGEWSVTFTEVWSGNVIDGFKKWMNNYHDFIGGKIRLFKDYQTTMTVNLLNPSLYEDNSAAKPKKVTLYRAWPTEVSVDEIKPSSSDPVNIKATIHYDYFVMGEEEEKAASSAA